MFGQLKNAACLLAMLALMAFMPLEASARLRASYEVSVSENGSHWSARAAESLETGQAMVQEMGDLKIELRPEVAASGEYSLHVSVSRKPTSVTSVVITNAHTF